MVRGHAVLAADLVRDFEILIVDDGSEDETPDLIAALTSELPRVRAWRHAKNVGIEPTLLELYRASRGKWVYYAPADGQVPARALEVLWSARNGQGCVVGRRRPRADPFSRRVIAAIYSRLIRALFRLPVSDIDSTKLLDGDRVRSMPLSASSTFAEAEILVRLMRAGVSIREVDIPHAPRLAGRGRGASPRVILRTCADLARFLIAPRQ